MSEARPFIFVLHNHQPVGNFDHVFEDAYRRCYEPLTQVLARFPGVKTGLHFSGPLLEWIARERGKYLELIAGLVERGQVEILGGGFYEPILSTLPDTDAAGQLEMMALFCQKYFGRRPAGMWLAERVWDPDLPRVLAPAGIRYTLLDDSHFRAAGVTDEVLSGHFLTEKAGHALAIFPIDKGLRYRIPFASADDVVQYIATTPGQACLTYGDDGEKFGVWPDTYEWVFEKKWLETFFGALQKAESDKKLRMMLPVEYLDERPPVGRVYLPNASYDEMMEWALPVEGMRRVHFLRERMKQAGEYETYGPYIRGGIWQNFLAKYPEANQIHKKMLLVSSRLQSAMDEVMEKSGRDSIEGDMGDLLGTAQRELYKGQCCCAYWHGLFGGLYLNNLRDSLYRSLLSAERILDEVQQGKDDWLSYEQEDLDRDGRDEILVSNRKINVYVRPHAGASVFEIDYKPKAFNVTDMLTRREEGYHELVRKHAEGHGQSDAGDAPKTIHDLVRVKEEGLERFLVYDDVQRSCFIDRFFAPEATLADVRGGAGKDRGDFAAGDYRIESIGVDDAADQSFTMQAWRKGSVSGHPIVVEKRYQVGIDASAIDVRYVLRNEGESPVELNFGSEINVNLLAGNEPSRYVKVGTSEARAPLCAEGTDDGVNRVSLFDEWMKIEVALELGAPARVFRYPVEAVSNSEGGFERTFQGSCVLPTWRLRLERGERKELSLRLAIREMNA